MKPERSKKMEKQMDGDTVTVKVWDVPTRVLHWTNALLIIALVALILGAEWAEAFGKGKAAEESFAELHAYVGRILVITLFARIAWGFIGNQYARFSDMVPYTREKLLGIWAGVKWYAGLCRKEPPAAIGHDPFASLFYLILFLALVLQAATGLLLAGIEFDMFPGTLITSGLSEHGRELVEEGAEAVHEFGMAYVLFFFAAHMGGVIAHTLHDRGALIASMLHGKKYFNKGDMEV